MNADENKFSNTSQLAGNHKKIAEAVWPDADLIFIGRGYCCRGYNDGKTYLSRTIKFDLLETDSNGEPTQQAKASAFDIGYWLWSNRKSHLIHKYLNDGWWLCEAIYRAACEVLGLEVRSE